MLRPLLPSLAPLAWHFFLGAPGTLPPESSSWGRGWGVLPLLPQAAPGCSVRCCCKQRAVPTPGIRLPDQGRVDHGGHSSWLPHPSPAAVLGGASPSTSLALTRLLERAQSPGELLRWLSQNPGKASATHYALGLCRLACLLPVPTPMGTTEKKKLLLPLLKAQPDFRFLSQRLASSCASLGQADLLGCLAASVALGLPTDSPLVQALQREVHRRLDSFTHRGVPLARGDTLSPSSPPSPLLTHCLEPLEKQRQPLASHRLRSQRDPHQHQGQQEAAARKRRHRILRLVCGLLNQPGALREDQLGLVEEVLALWAPEAGDEALAALFQSQLFSENCQERFIHSMADWFPGKAGDLAPSTVALVAKHLARHRLREPRLLDAVAAFLLQQIEHLENKVIQRLIFPFSRLSYHPSNHAELFPRLVGVLGQRPSRSPLATLNILLSLCQLQFCPPAPVLHQVFSPNFVANVTGSSCGMIAQRYLSLLDAAVALEVPGYDGPRLSPQYRVRLFDGALTADEANRKYSYKSLVGEGLQHLVGQDCYWQDEVVSLGYGVDFLLMVSSSGQVLPLGEVLHTSWGGTPICNTSKAQDVPLAGPDLLEGPMAGDIPPWEGSPGPSGSQRTPPPSSPSKTEPFLGTGTWGNAGSMAHLRFPIRGAAVQQVPAEGQGQCVPGGLTGPPISPSFSSAEGTAQKGLRKAEETHRLVLSVNDKWHYCRNSAVLVGSRAMRNRHLCLLGYRLLQLPYWELERLRGLEEAQRYLAQKLRDLQF